MKWEEGVVMTFHTIKWFTKVAFSLLKLIPKMKKGVKLKNTSGCKIVGVSIVERQEDEEIIENDIEAQPEINE